MAGGIDLGGSSPRGRKPLDVVINLVPFIDMMAVMIVFLISMAVWSVSGRLQVSSGGSGEGSTEPPTLPVTLLMSDTQMTLLVGGNRWPPISIQAHGDRGMKALAEQLDQLKSQAPSQSSLTVQPEDAVLYDDLVQVIDSCVAAGFLAVSVSPAS